MAWFNATPKPDPRSRRGQREAPTAVLSRGEQRKRDGLALSMPPNPAPHIIHRLVEIGLTEAAGMGAAPISWAAIHGWQQVTGVRLAPWEGRLLRKLSHAYLVESRRAEAETCPPPWRLVVTAREREVEERRLRALLG